MLKWIGQLLVWISLAGGALAAANAYLVSLQLPDKQLIGLTLAAPAGSVEKPDGTRKWLAEKDAVLTKELLGQLRQAGVKNVRVKQFRLSRWRGRWYFLLAAGGLLAGAAMVRVASHLGQQRLVRGQSYTSDSPAAILQRIHQTVDLLHRQTAIMADRAAALELIVRELGELQRREIAAMADTRQQLVARIGLGGMAAVMDSFAAAERQINRAWSAAVDGAGEEAAECLLDASGLLAETRQRLAASDPGAGQTSAEEET